MVNSLVEAHLANFKASGAELVMGEARFTGPKAVEVALNAGGTRQLIGDRVFINVGTRARLPNIPGLADARPMTHVEALNLSACRNTFSFSEEATSASSSPRRCDASAAASRSSTMVHGCLRKKTPTFPPAFWN